jgi:hypothetical protein
VPHAPVHPSGGPGGRQKVRPRKEARASLSLCEPSPGPPVPQLTNGTKLVRWRARRTSVSAAVKPVAGRRLRRSQWPTLLLHALLCCSARPSCGPCARSDATSWALLCAVAYGRAYHALSCAVGWLCAACEARGRAPFSTLLLLSRTSSPSALLLCLPEHGLCC